MNGLRSDYIEKIGKICLEEKKLLVLPCDHFSKLSNIEIGDSYIVNLDTSFKKGSHYIAIHVVKNKEINKTTSCHDIIYFDSIGLPLTNKSIINGQIKNGFSRLVYNRKYIQSGISYFRGYYCIAFLIKCCVKKNH